MSKDRKLESHNIHIYIFVFNYRHDSSKYVLELVPEHYADFIHKHWEYHKNSSIDFLKDSMKTLPVIGAFVRKNDGANPTDFPPVAWAVTKHNGEIGMTFTFPEHRRQGLGAAVTLKLSQELLKMGIIPRVIIFNGNPNSIKFHENIGFKKEFGAPLGYYVFDPVHEVRNQ